MLCYTHAQADAQAKVYKMRKGFVVSPSDLAQLQHRVLSKLQDEPIVCSYAREVPSLEQAGAVYFVISEISMCSTAYQELVLAAFGATEQLHRWLLRLDKAEIPLGFSMLRTLTEEKLGN